VNLQSSPIVCKSKPDKLTRRLAGTYKRCVVYLYTAVHDDGQAVLFSVVGGLFVDHAGLHPQYLGAGGHGVFGHGDSG
jgi:hypothetical protein